MRRHHSSASSGLSSTALFAPQAHAAHARGQAPARNGSWALAGALLGLLLTVLYYAPASWLASALAQISQHKVLLAEPQGRVWEGSARLLLAPGGQAAVLLPQRLRWTAQIHGLGLKLQLLPECCATQPATLIWQMGLRKQTLRIQNLDMTLPASLLAGLGTPFNTLGFTGSVRLHSPALDIKSAQGQIQGITGNARLELLQLASSLSTLPALGSYQIDIGDGSGSESMSSKGSTRVQLSTLAGALQLQGDGLWQNGRIHFTGEAHAAPGYEETLANILNVIGRRDGARSIIKL